MSVPNIPGIPTDPETPAELRARIDLTRQELGDTLEELAAKADVRARAQRKAREAMRTGRARRAATASGAVLAVALAALVLYRRRHRAKPTPWLSAPTRRPRPRTFPGVRKPSRLAASVRAA